MEQVKSIQNNIEGRFSSTRKKARKDAALRRDFHLVNEENATLKLAIETERVESMFLMNIMNIQKGDAKGENFCNICAQRGHVGETECPDVRKYQSLTRGAGHGEMVPEAIVSAKTQAWVKKRKEQTKAAKETTRALTKRARQNREEVQAGEIE